MLIPQSYLLELSKGIADNLKGLKEAREMRKRGNQFTWVTTGWAWIAGRRYNAWVIPGAGVAELADAQDLGTKSSALQTKNLPEKKAS